MPVSQNAFDDDIQQFIELAASLDVATIEELRKIANRLADSPDLIFEDRIRQFVDDESKDWQDKASSWVSVSLASAYLRGINVQEAEISSIVSNPRNQGNPIPAPFFADQSRMGGSISDEAADILEDYPEHWSVFSRYENTMQEAVNRARMPFYRSTVQHYRDLATLSMEDTFRAGDRATRRELAQQVMDTFTDSGIKTISFPTNHRMSVEAFAKREARSYMQKVAVEGQINRATEMGYDLVRINQYAGASPMCAPHQGNVYSVGGNSSQYPPLSSAIHDGTYTYGSGIYHDYCYSDDTEVFTSEGWKKFYELDGELIYSLNPETHKTEFVLYDEVIEKEDVHVMYGFDGPNINLMVTGNHRMYCSYDRKEYCFKEAKDLAKWVDKPTFHLCGMHAKNVTRAEVPRKYIYDKTAYCVRLVKNHVILVRREGTKKTTWSGNCGHYQSTYVPGVSESLGDLSDDPQEQAIINEMGEARGNEFIYKRRQELRDIERNIEKYNRMSVGALDKRDRMRFGSLVEKWQQKLDQQLNEYDFLNSRLPIWLQNVD